MCHSRPIRRRSAVREGSEVCRGSVEIGSEGVKGPAPRERWYRGCEEHRPGLWDCECMPALMARACSCGQGSCVRGTGPGRRSHGAAPGGAAVPVRFASTLWPSDLAPGRRSPGPASPAFAGGAGPGIRRARPPVPPPIRGTRSAGNAPGPANPRPWDVDAGAARRGATCRHLVYCGAIDEHLDLRFGALPYRSLRFERGRPPRRRRTAWAYQVTRTRETRVMATRTTQDDGPWWGWIRSWRATASFA